MNAKIEIPTKNFDAGFREYLKLSRRGIAEDVNQKSYSVCNTAVAITKRANKAAIRKALKSPSRIAPSSPAVAIIINAKRGQRGLRGLFGAAMKAKSDEFIQQHADAVNFLRAGWLSAVAVLARSIRKTPGKNAIQFLSRFGTQTGGGIAAKESNSPTAYFWNQAFSRQTSTPAGVKHAEDGLKKALEQETKRMGEYVARKQEQRARDSFRKFFRA